MFTVLLVEADPGPTWYLSERLFILFFDALMHLAAPPPSPYLPLSVNAPTVIASTSSKTH